jgi:hypothetical protein
MSLRARASHSLLAAALVPALLSGCNWFAPKAAKVRIKVVIYDNDNSFAATVYAQEVSTGETTKFAYGPHTPYLTEEIKKPGTYVFYATLVEAPDDYHYGFTGYQAAAYGHMTRGGTRDASTNLIALDLKPGENYQVYISDHWASLPVPGKPVTVAWHREPGLSTEAKP